MPTKLMLKLLFTSKMSASGGATEIDWGAA